MIVQHDSSHVGYPHINHIIPVRALTYIRHHIWVTISTTIINYSGVKYKQLRETGVSQPLHTNNHPGDSWIKFTPSM